MNELRSVALEAEAALAKLLSLNPFFWPNDYRKIETALEVIRGLTKHE